MQEHTLFKEYTLFKEHSFYSRHFFMSRYFSEGQLISEQICGVLNFPKMQRNIARISALASKMGQIKKVKAHYHPN